MHKTFLKPMWTYGIHGLDSRISQTNQTLKKFKQFETSHQEKSLTPHHISQI